MLSLVLSYHIPVVFEPAALTLVCSALRAYHRVVNLDLARLVATSESTLRHCGMIIVIA